MTDLPYNGTLPPGVSDRDTDGNDQPPEILVDLVAPPIPVRCWDWRAWRDGYEEGRQGWGKSSTEAVANLLEQERADEDGY
jgi:hypothetical protein